MEYVLFFALSAIAALLFGPVSAKLNSLAGSVQNSKAQQLLGSYAGRTAVTATAFFVVLIVAASLMSLLVGRKAAEVPTVG